MGTHERKAFGRYNIAAIKLRSGSGAGGQGSVGLVPAASISSTSECCNLGQKVLALFI